MKKYFGLFFLAFFVFDGGGFFPADALDWMNIAPTKDLANHVQRKDYRLGVRGSLISPSSTMLVNKISAYDLGLDLDTKLNEKIDIGSSFGLSSFVNNQGTSLNASYQIIRIGCGARFYVVSWGEFSGTDFYLHGEINYYAANKISEAATTGSSPSSFAGLGGQVGLGIEAAFSQNIGVFAQIDYLRASIKDLGANSLPLSGFTLATGIRMAIY